MPASRYWPLALVGAMGTWAVWSYASGGVIAELMGAALGGDRSIDGLRDALVSAGAWAPVAYVAAVTIEVMVAPIPGLLLYLPGGALFGGLFGGTLALIGNVIGASLAAWLAGAAGGRLLRIDDWPRLRRYSDRLGERGLLLVFLLRLNPLTSSDLVSYAAGLAGVPVWRVALGTALGMAPLCYAQSYASEWLFRWLPGSTLIILALALAYLAAVLYFLLRRGDRPSGPDASRRGRSLDP